MESMVSNLQGDTPKEIPDNAFIPDQSVDQVEDENRMNYDREELRDQVKDVIRETSRL